MLFKLELVESVYFDKEYSRNITGWIVKSILGNTTIMCTNTVMMYETLCEKEFILVTVGKGRPIVAINRKNINSVTAIE